MLGAAATAFLLLQHAPRLRTSPLQSWHHETTSILACAAGGQTELRALATQAGSLAVVWVQEKMQQPSQHDKADLKMKASHCPPWQAHV